MSYMSNIIVMILAFFLTQYNLFADQSFESVTANNSKYYFAVPTKLTIVESGEPTDCYLSYTVDSINWKKVSPTYQWGLGNIYTINWTPETTFTNGYLGLHTAPRNSRDFSFEPTDLTDVPVSVVFADAQFIEPITEYWYLDVFTFKFKYEVNSLPYTIQFQYSLDGVVWFDLKNIQIDNSGEQSFQIVNEYFKESPVKFRLTYNHIYGEVHNIAITDWVQYNQSSLKIRNKGYLERGLWNDNTIIELLLQKERLSNSFFHDVIVSCVVGTDTITTEIIASNDNSFTFNLLNYTLTSDYTGKVKLLFYTTWGQFLNELTLSYKDKFLTVSEIPTEVNPLEIFFIYWSGSDNFKKIKIEESYNNSEFSAIIESWDIEKSPYSLSRMSGSYRYRITASDEFETLSSVTNELVVTTPTNPCDSLSKEVERLTLVVDSLSKIGTDSLTIILLVDKENNSVIERVVFENKNIINFQLSDGNIDLTLREFIKQVYISDYTGGVISTDKVEGYSFYKNVSDLVNGYYYVVLITVDGLRLYRFLK